MAPLLPKKFTLIHLGSISLMVSIITFALTTKWKDKQLAAEIGDSTSYNCNTSIKRMEGFNFVSPVLFIDEDCESQRLAPLKQKINAVVENYIRSGDIVTASVFMKDYGFHEWIGLNETEKYEPGSLFKVPILITILKISEDSPGYLNKSILFAKPFDINKNVAYTNKTIQLGKSYTVRELLTYMIKYSDNNATALLEANMNPETLQKLFSDLGLEAPNMYASNYYFTAKDYSLFMRIIYNAGYLTAEDSEYAAELLNECEFKDGIAQGIPSDIRLAHKFGEAGNPDQKQLHESAIVYLKHNPYLLTVMTKGKDNKKLAQLIAAISKVVYTDMQAQANAN